MNETYTLFEEKKVEATNGIVHWTVDGRHYQWKLFTGLSIVPKDWNQPKRRAKKGTAVESQVNGKLLQTETTLHKLFAEMDAMGIEPLPDVVRERYTLLIGKAKPKNAPDFFTAFNQFITESEATVRPRTISTYQVVKNSLEITLTEDELQLIRDVELSDGRLSRVRDCFLVQVGTGVRYSDLAVYRPEHVKGNSLRITTIGR